MAEKKLRPGFTTGAAAAAAAKAALITLVTGQKPDQVEISFLTGERKTIRIHDIQHLSPNLCQAVVIKDAGDDPDITHKAEIGARVSLEAGPPDIRIVGGKGVGTVTKPGLEITVGEPAINPGPRKMIVQSVHDAYGQLMTPFENRVHVEVFVPRGEVLAQKTLNARLGILGGISILGTTGIVRPLSHEAYIATIRSGICVARANGAGTLVFTTGRRSERFAMAMFPEKPSDNFIQTGDFFKAGIDAALACDGIRAIVYTVFFGKAVKMALGFAHTHAAKSELTLKTLAQWAATITRDQELASAIQEANTARHAFAYIYPGYPALLSHVGRQIRHKALGFAQNRLRFRIIILDFDGNPAFDSDADRQVER